MSSQFKELMGKSKAELNEALINARAQLSALKFSAHGRQLKQLHKIKATKKTIARLLTLLKSKQTP